jgi:proteasome lid subunit RPN8/RPN11
MTQKIDTTPDIRQLAEAEFNGNCPESRFPGAGVQDFRIFFAPESHQAIQKHARETTAVEVGGVLVGNWGRDDDGPYVAVTEIIRCDAATSKSGEVTFTHEAWNVVNREMDTRFAALKIVGWYHTHPGFGVFLSERDRFIQEHFFGNPGQIAYVVDPLANTEGVFAWRSGKASLWPHFWVGARIHVAPENASESQQSATSQPSSAQQSTPSPQEKETLRSLASRAIMYMLIFLIGYLLAGMKNGWEERMIVNGVVAHYGACKGIRPGLRENLETVVTGLDAVSAELKAFAPDAEKAEGEAAKNKQKQWNELQATMQNMRLLLGRIEEVYSLTPEEEAVMAKVFAEKFIELEGVKKSAPDGTKPTGKKEDKSKSAASGNAVPRETNKIEPKPQEKKVAP